MSDYRHRLAPISGVLPFNGPEGTDIDDPMHQRTYSGDSGYRSRASSKACSDHEVRRGPGHLGQGIEAHQEYVRRYTKSKHDAVVRDDKSRYGKAMGSGSRGIRSGASRHTEVAMHQPEPISTVSGRLFYKDNDIGIGEGIMDRDRRDSGFLSSFTLADETEGDYNAKGSSDLLHDPLQTNLGHGYKSDFCMGPVGDRYTVGAEGEKPELHQRGQNATPTPSEAGASGKFAESSRWSQTKGLQFPDSRSIEQYNQGYCISSPSLLIPDPMKWESQAVAASHDHSDSSWVAKSERDIRSYAYLGDGRKGSDYHSPSVEVDRKTHRRSDSSLDSVLSKTRSLQSNVSLSSGFGVHDGNEHTRVNSDVSRQDGLSLYPGTEVSMKRSSVPDIPLDKLFIRKVLSVAGMCVPSPAVVVSDKEWVLNSTQSAQAVNDAYCAASSEPSLELEQPSAELDAQLDPVRYGSNVNLEKRDYLEAFDRMYRAAKLMGINTVGRVIQISNFAGAMLDSRGGYLSIDDLDVHLYVPCGAVPDGPPQLVYVFVEGNLSSGRDQLTPCVHCGPSTLRFRKDVFLTYPHCAKDAAKYRFTFTKSKSGGYIREIRDGEDGVIHVDNHSITMTMNHFCGYSACAPVLEKSMLVCTFINEDIPAGRATIRLRICDDIESNLKEVEESESIHDFFLADPVQRMEVGRTGDVQGTLTLVSESWEITEPVCGRQTFRLSDLWHAACSDIAQATPSKLFHVRRKSQQRERLTAKMKVFQGDREQYSVDFLVKMPRRGIFHQNVPRSFDELLQLMKGYIYQQPTTRHEPMQLLTEGVYQRLCDELDVEAPVAHDWRLLPENLRGIHDRGHRWITSIETRAQRERQSPTGLVLDAFFAESKKSRKSKGNTLRDLKQGLLGLNRQDLHFAVSAIDHQLKGCEGAGITAMAGHDPDPNNNSTRRDHCHMTRQEMGERGELPSGDQCRQIRHMPTHGSPMASWQPRSSVDLHVINDQVLKQRFNSAGSYSLRKDSAYSSLSALDNFI
ncbi:uncharacterized protein LOC119741534 [Patiria miniata]|uniref:Netrin receptor UNC5 n=1 Tax=Patiria miniata TaxID=46514 RepID=A0A914BB59_PATMI|nr:uncharacterized protein LOC119741534 [Patiria miniata]